MNKIIKVGCFFFVVYTFFYVATGADGMDVPQGLHEGSIYLDVAIGDG